MADKVAFLIDGHVEKFGTLAEVRDLFGQKWILCVNIQNIQDEKQEDVQNLIAQHFQQKNIQVELIDSR